MLYREAGDFKTSYRDDSQTFPLKLDRWGYWIVLAIAFLVVPFVITDYWANSVLVPFLIYAIAALGLNILVGYAGQVSLGTGGFMAVGAYATYKLATSFPEISILIHIVLAGGITAAVGVLFGLPSLRIKGFYLAVATLAAQFFLVWLFNKVPWFYNYSASGQITAPERTFLGYFITGPQTTASAKYLVCLVFVVLVLLFWALGPADAPQPGGLARLAAAVAVILPLVLTSVLGNALMAFMGIGVKVATLPVIALGVGIGVDYGIYIYSRLETYLRQGMPLQEAYYETLKSTGKAVLFTGVCLAIGVATWIFSAIKFQADMGLMLTFMFLWNMIGAIWLLPALARFLINPEKLRAKG